MKSRIILFLAILSLTSSIAAKKTNVVLILIDDLSHYGVSAYGSKEVSSLRNLFHNVPVSTPRIDKLADEGLMCNYAYAYPLCEATRIALMSGQHNSRNYLRCKSQHASDITFGDTFQKAGYATGIFGKWKQTRGTKDIHAKDYIYQFGWDEFCCFDVVGERQRFINPNLVINGEIHNYEGRTDLDPITGRRWYGPDICNRKALQFIDKNKDKPFFLYYPMLLVHDEHKPTPDTKPNHIFDNFDEDKSNRNGHHGDDHRYFPDMIKYMDKLIGQVVDKLDELNLRENTLVVVMGDNGTKEAFSHVLDNNSIYPGRKGGNADNGLHVPLVLSMPKTIEQGKKYDALVNLTDIYPTLTEAASVPLHPNQHMDGISFWQQALGSKKEHRDHIYTWYNANYLYTSTETVIEYAFNKNFKYYSPSAKFPDGRFFDLRTDLLEREGSYRDELPFKVFQYSGIPIKDLDKAQKRAYKDLSKIVQKNKYVPVNRLKIKSAKKSISVGETTQLSCSISPKKATRKNIVWVSENPEIVSINKFGEAVAHSKGEATITAYSWDDAFPQASNAKVTYKTNGIKDTLLLSVNN